LKNGWVGGAPPCLASATSRSNWPASVAFLWRVCEGANFSCTLPVAFFGHPNQAAVQNGHQRAPFCLKFSFTFALATNGGGLGSRIFFSCGWRQLFALGSHSFFHEDAPLAQENSNWAVTSCCKTARVDRGLARSFYFVVAHYLDRVEIEKVVLSSPFLATSGKTQESAN
jgi:hypothetical protein